MGGAGAGADSSGSRGGTGKPRKSVNLTSSSTGETGVADIFCPTQMVACFAARAQLHLVSYSVDARSSTHAQRKRPSEAAFVRYLFRAEQ